MTGNNTLDVILAIQGAISAIASLIALLAPKGSKIGIVAGKIGADLKGQTVGAQKLPRLDEPGV